MLHESIHAYLIVYFKIDGINAKGTYPEILQEWGSRNNDLNAIHHNEMTRSLVSQIGDALEVYGVSKGYRLDKQFYQDMAWGGLNETSAFKALSHSLQERF